MQTIASVDELGGETNIQIKDVTRNWLFETTQTETIDTTSAGWAWLFVAEPGAGTNSRLLLQFSTIKVSGV